MLALASALSALETDPGALGKRYQLTASLAPDLAAAGARDPRRAGERAALRGAGRRLVLARRDDRRDRLSDATTPSSKRRRWCPAAGCADRTRPRSGRAWPPRSVSPPDRRSRSRFPRAPSCGCGCRASSARSTTTGAMAFVPASALLAADPSAPSQIAVRLVPGLKPSARDGCLEGPGRTPIAGGDRSRPRRAARRGAADHPARHRDRRRPGLPVRADPGVRADRAGAPAHGGRAARVRRRSGGSAAAADSARRSRWCSRPPWSGCCSSAYCSVRRCRGSPRATRHCRCNATLAEVLATLGGPGDRGRRGGRCGWPGRPVGNRSWRSWPADDGPPARERSAGGGAVRRITRRELVAEGLLAAGVLALDGCGAGNPTAHRIDVAFDLDRPGGRRSAAGRSRRGADRSARAWPPDRRRRRCSPRSRTSPTRTCSTRPPRLASLSRTVSDRRSSPPSGRRRRSRCRCSPGRSPRSARSVRRSRDPGRRPDR